VTCDEVETGAIDGVIADAPKLIPPDVACGVVVLLPKLKPIVPAGFACNDDNAELDGVAADAPKDTD
jgi:hypothetical protein